MSFAFFLVELLLMLKITCEISTLVNPAKSKSCETFLPRISSCSTQTSIQTVISNLQCLCSCPIFPVFKANQLFSLEINLMLNMGMFAYVIKICSKILPLSYPSVDICLQHQSPLCADVVFTPDTFYSNLRKTGVFPLKPGMPK